VNYQPLLHVFANKQNKSLQSLKTNAPAALQASLHFYTQLNASGATQLLTHAETASTNEWLNVIVQNSHDDDFLSVLFYTLIREPTFLLSYSPARDKMAYHHRPRLQQQKPKSPSAPLLVSAPRLNLNSRRRQRSVNAPFCWALNLPM
jgi:hypothetical protein